MDESEPVSRVQTLETVEDALQFLRKISTYEKINSSVESDQKSGIDAKMVGIALGVDEETTAYIPLPPTLPNRDNIIKELASLFDDDKKTWVMENAKLALQLLWHDGITVKGRLWDTMVAHYLINPDLHRNKEYMERFAERLLQLEGIRIRTGTPEEFLGDLITQGFVLD